MQQPTIIDRYLRRRLKVVRQYALVNKAVGCRVDVPARVVALAQKRAHVGQPVQPGLPQLQLTVLKLNLTLPERQVVLQRNVDARLQAQPLRHGLPLARRDRCGRRVRCVLGQRGYVAQQSSQRQSGNE